MTSHPTSKNLPPAVGVGGRMVACLVIVILILSGSFYQAKAQEDEESDKKGIIEGRVFNERTGRYISNARVTVRGTSKEEFTDSFGEYEIYGVPEGEHIVQAQYTGLTPQTARVTVESGVPKQVDFNFTTRSGREEEEENIFELEEFVVDGSNYQSMRELAIQEERFSVNLKNVASTDAYGMVAQGNVGEFVKFMPGVLVNYGGGSYSSGADATSISIRGYGAEQTAVTVDGVPVSNAEPGSLTRAIGLDTLSINNASRVEVIKVPSPDQPDASVGGTVNLISKTAFEYSKPTFSFRAYMSLNSENLEIFEKTPGPVDESTYKALPGLELSYALPLNEKLGFTFNLSTSNQFNENHELDLDWEVDEDSEDPPDEFVNEDGSVISPIYQDAAHPYLNNIQISDSPRIANRNSGSVKVDYRPFDGVLLTGNYQASTFESRDAERLFEMNAGGRRLERYGPDFMESREGQGKSDLIVRALDREGMTHTGYLKAQYIKGPWDARAHLSYSTSEGELLSSSNGHFSDIQVGLGGIDRAGFYEIADGVPGRVEYYDEAGEPINPADLDEYNIAGYDPEDPQASSLRVLAGETYSENEVITYKFDIKRDLDFLPFDWMNMAVKVGVYQEDDTEEKSGPGTGYGYQYLGESGVVLELADFRDDGYVGISPGFGFEPREWPDVYKVYDFFKDNPEGFSDSHDIPQYNQASGDLEENSVAAENYISYVNTQKSVTETDRSAYFQLENDFFSNRLSVVAGMRQSWSERTGRSRFTDSDWSSLRFDRDANGDGHLDVMQGEDAPFPASASLTEIMRVDQAQAYEDAGAVYADGTPFVAGQSYSGESMDIFTRGEGPRANDYYFQEVSGVRQGYLVNGTLPAAQLQNIPNYDVSEKSTGKPSPIVSASFDLTDNWIIRASWARTFAKRDFEGPFGLLTDGGIQYNQTSESIRIQNPDLEPWVANKYDFGVSYYTDTGGKFTVTYFINEEDNFFVGEDFTVTEGNFEQLLPQFGIPVDPSFVGWDIETTVNGEGTAQTTGYELEISQDMGILGAWGRYFYVYASYSSKDRNADEVDGDPVGPTADKFAAGGINFEYGPFNARVNATWRSEDVDGVSTMLLWPDPSDPPDVEGSEEEPYEVSILRYNPAELKIDINMSYRFWKRYQIDFSAKNITNTQQEDLRRSVGDAYPSYAQTLKRKEFGVQFTVGISGEF